MWGKSQWKEHLMLWTTISSRSSVTLLSGKLEHVGSIRETVSEKGQRTVQSSFGINTKVCSPLLVLCTIPSEGPNTDTQACTSQHWVNYTHILSNHILGNEDETAGLMVVSPSLSMNRTSLKFQLNMMENWSHILRNTCGSRNKGIVTLCVRAFLIISDIF